MKISEAEHYLKETIKYLIQHWYETETGIVACAIVDGSRAVYAASSQNGEYWRHAERNAYHHFKFLYGDPSCNAAFITTLSPCVCDLKRRTESSCSDLIKKLGIKRIHFGALDTFHVPSISKYEEMGFIPTVTQNEEMAKICKRLIDMFAEYDSRINTELPAIKRKLGDSFFDDDLEQKHTNGFGSTYMEDYHISTDKKLMSVKKVWILLRDCFWSKNIPIEYVEKLIKYSLCFAVLKKDNRELVGFGRVISDYTTYAYICDVIIDSEYQGKGLGVALVEEIMNHPELQGLKTRALTTTAQARKIYERFGFKTIEESNHYLEINDLEIYSRSDFVNIPSHKFMHASAISNHI